MSPGSTQPDPSKAESPRVDLDATLEAEIEAALGDMSVDDMIDMGSTATQPARAGTQRETRTGSVVAIHGNDVLVEFGPRSQGICPLVQFREKPELGQRLDFMIERFDENEGLLVLSREGAVQKAEWEALEIGHVVEARCTGMVKGGLELMVAQHKAFMPASQVDVHFVKDISVLLNEKVICEVIELDRRRRRIVLSRRKVLAAEQEKRRKELLSSIEAGRQVTGMITSIQPYGAFADIGGIDGLIHISDMSYERIKHPSEVVKEGDQVQVQILKVELDQEPPRISLGMKQCMADPFQAKINELTPGETVSGKITKLMAFGAFMEVAPGVEGLIHISQLSHERVNRVSQVVKPDEIVTARVLSVDPDSRRISLSLKAMQERPEDGGGELERKEDPHLRKLKAQLGKKFGDQLKGGIG
ncbi:MAG: 30S ribosomal protein S1 [Planctomycetota bacterium]